jgi:imidazolonepropionase-like amidohydrolase
MRDIVDGRWAEPSTGAGVTLGEGLFALPGLVDAHSHIAGAQLDAAFVGNVEEAGARARAALSQGVTLLLDKGWRDDTTIRVADAIADHERPDIEAAGAILAPPDGYYTGVAHEVPGHRLGDESRSAAETGRGWVKLIGDWPRRGVGPVANYTESEMRQAVASAEGAGARVAVHTMAREVPSMAVAAGVQSIEHGLFLTSDDLASLGDRGGMWVPTILRVEATLAHLGEGSSGGVLLLEGLANVRRLLADAIEAGVHVLAGTDLVGSPSNVASEALKLIEYGLTPKQAVHAVSVAARDALGRPAAFSVGAPADAVFYAADPTTDPAVLSHPQLVLRLGRTV